MPVIIRKPVGLGVEYRPWIHPYIRLIFLRYDLKVFVGMLVLNLLVVLCCLFLIFPKSQFQCIAMRNASVEFSFKECLVFSLSEFHCPIGNF